MIATLEEIVNLYALHFDSSDRTGQPAFPGNLCLGWKAEETLRGDLVDAGEPDRLKWFFGEDRLDMGKAGYLVLLRDHWIEPDQWYLSECSPRECDECWIGAGSIFWCS